MQVGATPLWQYDWYSILNRERRGFKDVDVGEELGVPWI